MLFAFVPVLLRHERARRRCPGSPIRTWCCRRVFLQLLPPWLGALALAAVFSTEVDTCDAILFMLSTSVSKDIYRRHVNPGATDAQLLRVARMTAVAGGIAGVLLSIYLATVIGALRVFYSLLGVSLFVPMLGGLCQPPRRIARGARGDRRRRRHARRGSALLGRPYPWVDPTLAGIIASAVAFVGVLGVRRLAGPAEAGPHDLTLSTNPDLRW